MLTTVLVIGIDALSSNLLLNTLPELPNLARLMREGAYSFHAKAEVSTRSPQNWATHFYGHGPAAHGWYRDAVPRGCCANLTSVFDLVPATYAVTADWPQLAEHIPPFVDAANDDALVQGALAALMNQTYDLVVTRFEGVDNAAHDRKSTKEALVTIDAQVALLAPHAQHVIVISDHGTRPCAWWSLMCRSHYGARLSELNTPVIITGPRVHVQGPLNRRLTHQDTAYFILRLLNISIPCQWQLGQFDSNCSTEWPGKEVDVLLEEEELRNAVDAAAAGFTLIICGYILAQTMFSRHGWRTPAWYKG